jgi:RNA polymerase sigma-70 factor (ECF subfamily)
MTNEQDISFIEGLKKGNETAYKSLYNQYYIELYVYSKRYVRDMDAAKEVVQDVMINLWAKREELNFQDNLKAYLYKSVSNRSINYLKKKKYTINIDEELEDKLIEEDMHFIENLEDNQLEERIDQEINKLPDKCKQAFRLSRFEELKYNEIADQMGVSVKTVEAHISNALNKLSNALKDYLHILIILIIHFFK